MYENVFVGTEAVNWLVDNGLCASRAAAVAFGQRLLKQRYFHHVVSAAFLVFSARSAPARPALTL